MNTHSGEFHGRTKGWTKENSAQGRKARLDRERADETKNVGKEIGRQEIFGEKIFGEKNFTKKIFRTEVVEQKIPGKEVGSSEVCIAEGRRDQAWRNKIRDEEGRSSQKQRRKEVNAEDWCPQVGRDKVVDGKPHQVARRTRRNVAPSATPSSTNDYDSSGESFRA